jgi:hypothetical protein
MASLIHFPGPIKIARFSHHPGGTVEIVDALDQIFVNGTATEVEAHIYPKEANNSISHVSIRGYTDDESANFTIPITWRDDHCNPYKIKFTLGTNAGEQSGRFNKVKIKVTDTSNDSYIDADARKGVKAAYGLLTHTVRYFKQNTATCVVDSVCCDMIQVPNNLTATLTFDNQDPMACNLPNFFGNPHEVPLAWNGTNTRWEGSISAPLDITVFVYCQPDGMGVQQWHIDIYLCGDMNPTYALVEGLQVNEACGPPFQLTVNQNVTNGQAVCNCVAGAIRLLAGATVI